MYISSNLFKKRASYSCKLLNRLTRFQNLQYSYQRRPTMARLLNRLFKETFHKTFKIIEPSAMKFGMLTDCNFATFVRTNLSNIGLKEIPKPIF